MLRPDLFATVQPLRTDRLDLVPLGPEHLDGTWAALRDPEAMRLSVRRSSSGSRGSRGAPIAPIGP